MNNVGQHLISGALSGFASTICLQPFDLLKTRLQQREGAAVPRNTTTILQTTRQIVSSTGVLGLWRGTSASLVRGVPGIALYLTSLNHVRTLLAASPYFASARPRDAPPSAHTSALPTLTSRGNLLAGATTRVAVGLLLNPASVLKARYESNMYAYTSLASAFRAIARGGRAELFRGFSASALRDAPYSGLFVVCYELIKREAAHSMPPSSHGASAALHSGAAVAAGTIATLATHPFDVIKTKIQVRSEDRYQGFVRTVQTVWRQRGVSGFFDGASLRLSRKVLSSAIGWAVYESVLVIVRTHALDV
ncbi:solute carrier family 25 member 38 [Artomyces pyxidatus]|uniref:Solute carrier family 25 member 38 n=1 Tax=Artomyces pyxidatus TaxID=48021 RepID=A0ACB8SLP6_9AGAM|nr:solute carrier family 25 member 38 [Artomyces pyxidatus]